MPVRSYYRKRGASCPDRRRPLFIGNAVLRVPGFVDDSWHTGNYYPTITLPRTSASQTIQLPTKVSRMLLTMGSH